MSNDNSPSDVRALKGSLQNAYNRVETTIEPLLHQWLQEPLNGENLHYFLGLHFAKVDVDAEAEDFRNIRMSYLPEVVLAYLVVLDFSARCLSRDLLLKGMDLAALIAAEDSDLAVCFLEARRMNELVDSFACMSKAMIQAEDQGAKNVKGKKKRNGETLSIWTVRAPSP